MTTDQMSLIDLLKLSLLNGFVGSIGATGAIFLFYVVKDRL